MVDPCAGRSEASSKQESASRAGDTVPLVLPSARTLQIITAMRNTMEIRDRSFGSKMYSTCFLASAAIDWLLVNGYVDSRAEGIHQCQEFLDSQLIVGLTCSDSQFQVRIEKKGRE